MAKFRVHLLDVGAIEYGDAILVEAGGLTALIDGGKIASGRSTQSRILGNPVNHKPIDEQIEDILGTRDLDLLVVTHCHSDHVGCLPSLFAENRLSAAWALLADPAFGFGIQSEADLLPDFALMTKSQKLRLALREEPVTSRNRAQILEFIEDSARDYTAYLEFVQNLETALGTQAVSYRGLGDEASPGLSALLDHFAPMGLQILGPSTDQLGACAVFLAGRDGGVASNEGSCDSFDLVDAYLAKLDEFRADSAAEGLDDGSGENGNAVNNQSMILTLSNGIHKVLLTGDMQFVRPQIPDELLKSEMATLRDTVVAAGPFTFVKLSHHGATNGQNFDFIKSLGAKLLAISTGALSGKHPTEPTLKALNAWRDEASAQWARVDLNGIVSFIGDNNNAKLRIQHNNLNDSTLPAKREIASDAAPSPSAPESVPPIPLKVVSQPSDSGSIEVTLRIPNRKTKVNIQIEVDPGPLP